jgi:hypothetical protein
LDWHAVAPAPDEEFAGQAEHAVAPGNREYVPAAQAAQTLAPLDDEKVPAPHATHLRKTQNLGATDSGRIALARAREKNPEYFFLIEADYIFIEGKIIGTVIARKALEQKEPTA